ncbi:MAG TPA: UvrD-helicase domain-containing protein [Fibrobacteria bacterium]|nr:UvrD-helicase domain-containing protein [Fibrobacteria bacterium]
MPDPIDLSRAEVDLSRHGIVEAHAGTGKTWTIVRRVILKALTRPDDRLHVRDLLVVTYTDKAAGELRSRLREGLEEELGRTADTSLRAHLEDCIRNLGEAWIGTIHATGLRLLRAYPFESSLPFHVELVDDGDGLDGALFPVLESADGPWWTRPRESRERLGGHGMESLRSEAAALARSLLDPSAFHDLPDPSECASQARSIAERMAEPGAELVRRIQSRLLPRLRGIPPVPRGRKIPGLVRHWEALDPDTPPLRAGDLSPNKADDPGFDLRKPEEAEADGIWQSALSHFQELLGEPAPLHAHWVRMRDLAPEVRERATFVEEWAKASLARWTERKRAEALISYADILARLAEALEDPRFLAAVRGRIRIGIVDEFQDTGRASWKIFHRWFLPRPGAATDGVLFLVGDPKQSVYSFQGADIATYREACSELEGAGARRYVLRENFRSRPEVVEGVNEILLAAPSWFGSGIDYGTEQSSRAVEREPVEDPDFQPHPSVRVAQVAGNASAARTSWATQVARAILSWNGRLVRIPSGDSWSDPRPLCWADFAVLVQGRRHVAAFAQTFREAGIPWALYKQEGVFSSRSAHEWRVVLDALGEGPVAQEARRLSAFTRLFGVPVGSPPSPEGEPMAEIWLDWRLLAASGRWSELLRAISNSGWTARILSGEDADREWMDHRQVRRWILESLLSGETPAQVARHLGRLSRGEDVESREVNLLQRATERERVQILTMHAAKGLEFPVVFLGPGASDRSGRNRPAWSWISPRGVHVGSATLPAHPQVEIQRVEEDRRLLYVALTRAKILCGLPVFRDRQGSPADLLSKALIERFPEGIRGNHSGDWEPFGPPAPRRSEGDATGPGPSAVVSDSDLLALGLRQRTVRQASFTALVRGSGGTTLEGRVGRSEESAPQDESEVDDTWLPRGAKTGDALHEILELLLSPQADLSWVLDGTPVPARVETSTRDLLRHHGLGRVPVGPVLDLLRRVLSFPLALPDGSGPVRLAEIPAEDRRCEVEFHRAVDGRGLPVMPSSPLASWVVGHIDLLFRRLGAWYVVDWKSNALPSWSAAAVEESVRSHAYDLQARIYAHAVRDALPGERFGGCLWIYLRGFARSGASAFWSNPADSSEDFLVERALAEWLAPPPGLRT